MTEIVELIAYVAIFVGTLGALSFFCLRQYYVARRKGYSPVAAGSLVGGAIIISIFAALFTTIGIDDHDWSNAQKNAFAFALLALPPPLAVGVLVLVLPRRNARQAGRRSVPFLWSHTARRLERALYWSGGLVMIAGFVGLWWLDTNTAVKIVNFGFSLLAVPPLFAYYRKRARAPTLHKIVKADTRPAVLYLRAFYQESDAFTWGPKDEMASYTSQPITAQTWYTISVTFEQYLGAAISRDVGPFVALGNPEDVLPPEGAARAYAKDSDWQGHFVKLADSAAAIVMEVSRSDNLCWEMAAIRSDGWQQKLFVITPPVPKSNRAFYRWVYGTLRAARGIPVPRWQDFASALANAGFCVDVSDPGPGAVVAFNASGSAEVIARNAVEPPDYVLAIKTRLHSRQTTPARPVAVPR
jgi:hypothetical protein